MNILIHKYKKKILKEKKQERNFNIYEYKHFPNTKEQLQKLVDDESICLGKINISKITDMSWLFENSTRTDFSGIETWDTSNVINMEAMFYKCINFNHNITNWDTSNVTDMSNMFAHCTNFNQDLSKWKINSECDTENIFLCCYKLKEDYKPKALQEESISLNM